MKKKTTIFLIMFLVLFVGNLIICYAQEVEPRDSFTDGFICEINTDGTRTYTIVGYESTIYTNIIPAEIDGYTVTRIADGAFKNKPQITGKIKLPDAIKSIGDEAFAGCVNITSISMGSNLKTIGDSAFANCTSLENVNFNNVQEIGNDAFFKCYSMVSGIEFPKTIKSIGDTAFYLSNVKEMKFQTVKAPTITEKTFEGAENLKIIAPKYSTGYTVEKYWPENIENYIIEGDINTDGIVNSADAAIVLEKYKYNNPTQKDLELADLNGDGLLNSADAAKVLSIYKYSK
ncbi:MAG: leucine-rich repeat protein [Clostridia bacterium]|nr:leucine-rich repeat protein [Clostridia bacterium]